MKRELTKEELKKYVKVGKTVYFTGSKSKWLVLRKHKDNFEVTNSMGKETAFLYTDQFSVDVPDEDFGVEFPTHNPSPEKEDAKTGDGKLRYSLLPYEALAKVVAVQEFGAKKYPVDSWKAMTGDYKRRYKDAAQRHLAAMMNGEEIDPESGLPHAAHLACNALFLTYFEVKEEK